MKKRVLLDLLLVLCTLVLCFFFLNCSSSSGPPDEYPWGNCDYFFNVKEPQPSSAVFSGVPVFFHCEYQNFEHLVREPNIETMYATWYDENTGDYILGQPSGSAAWQFPFTPQAWQSGYSRMYTTGLAAIGGTIHTIRNTIHFAEWEETCTETFDLLVVEPICETFGIKQPFQGGTFTEGDAVFFQIDDPYTLLQAAGNPTIQWSSDIDGPLGTAFAFTTSQLITGVHTISADVSTDLVGECLYTIEINVSLFEAFSLPDTGQITCYDSIMAMPFCPSSGESFFGQDANYIDPPPAVDLTDNSDGTVTDNVTGLVWMKSYQSSVKWDDASDYCSLFLEPGWRLPKRRELLTVLNYGGLPSAMDTGVFDAPASVEIPYFWSSTGNDNYAWYVDAQNGLAGLADKSNTCNVRCVQGDPIPAANTEYNGDSTFTDRSTGLMWQLEDFGPMSWEDALSTCENSSLAGYPDWKLSDIREIESLVDFSTAIQPADSPLQLGGGYWSSTTWDIFPNFAWLIDFTDGEIFSDNKGVNYYARCVRKP